MDTYQCSCGNTLFFENSVCYQCGKQTGFVPQLMRMVDIEAASTDTWQSQQLPGQLFRKCSNYSEHEVCNWLIPADESNHLCPACQLNKIIPDLSKSENKGRWYRLERSKRRTLYSLYKLGLQVPSMYKDPELGLEFCFMEDIKEYQPFTQELITYNQIMTGHHSGTITINIEEADPILREVMRQNMNEPYRTTLGHIRHETGHYFWDRLISGTYKIDSFRQVFGDEQKNYQQSLQRYYQQGPRADWQTEFISAYASSHPWEDWAECWAHYLHMTDTMETANHFALSLQDEPVPSVLSSNDSNQDATSFDDIITSWLQLTNAMNALNRSMGLPDAYPFSISEKVAEKLTYIHHAIAGYVSTQ